MNEVDLFLADKKNLHITSRDGEPCDYQTAVLNKNQVYNLILDLQDLYEEMEGE